MRSNQGERNAIIKILWHSILITDLSDWFENNMFRGMYYIIANAQKIKHGFHGEQDKHDNELFFLNSMQNKGLIKVKHAHNCRGWIRRKVFISEALQSEFERLDTDIIEGLFLSRQNENIKLFDQILKGILTDFEPK
jgi:hypothetical protein